MTKTLFDATINLEVFAVDANDAYSLVDDMAREILKNYNNATVQTASSTAEKHVHKWGKIGVLENADCSYITRAFCKCGAMSKPIEAGI